MKRYLIATSAIAVAAVFFAGGVLAGKFAVAPDVVALDTPVAPDAPVDAAIRSFLERNPQVVVEAQQRYADLQAQEEAKAVKLALTDNRDAIENDPASAILGNPNGKTTVVEFFDYNCGYCRRAHEDMVALVAQNPDVRLVLRQFPILGPDSLKAHQVAMAFQTLYPEKYASFHAGLLTASGKADEASALQIAIGLGGDEAALRTAMADAAVGEAFSRTDSLARMLKITGTPSYIIGDQVIGGAIGLDAMNKQIELAGAAATNG
jgi:protein-disulfide isomerase